MADDQSTIRYQMVKAMQWSSNNQERLHNYVYAHLEETNQPIIDDTRYVNPLKLFRSERVKCTLISIWHN